MRSEGTRPILLPLVACMLLLANACAGPGQLAVEPTPTGENPAEQVRRLEYDLGTARENQIDVLSPTWFERSETSLADAKKGLERGDSLSEILKSLAYGRAQLRRAEETADAARAALDEAIKARDLARAAGAASFGKEYPEAEESFLELTKAIEGNDLDRARRNQGKVVRAFDRIELRAIKEQILGEARTLIEQAEREGAARLAPGTLEAARKKLAEADALISEHRHRKEMTHGKAAEAIFHARRLLQVTRQSAKVKAMPPEQTTLWMEGVLHEITGKLSAADMRSEPFALQVQNILATIDGLQKDQQFLAGLVKGQQAELDARKRERIELEASWRKQLAALDEASRKKIAALDEASRKQIAEVEEALKKKIVSLEGEAERVRVEKERLAAEREFQLKYNDVRAFFSPDEAEVYKEGRYLVVRLKAIRFPVGKEVVLPENHGLLTKVQRAIRTFGEPDVIVEGHTDSTGSKERNDLLSRKRAEAVRDYLVSNGTLPGERISAVGYGSSRPLASNDTERGRAINRRIDVVIAPSAPAAQ